MNINDYINVMARTEPDPELKDKIIEKCLPEKKRINKRRLIPILAAAAVICAGTTAVVAGGFMGIFKKQFNFEMSISEVDAPQYTSESDDDLPKAHIVPILKAQPRTWDENKLHEIFDNGREIAEKGDWKDNFINSKYDEYSAKWWRYSDDTVIYFETGNIGLYHSDSEHNYGWAASILQAYHKYEELLFPETSLESLDRNDAVKQADELIEKLGIPVHDKKVIALDKENMKKVYNVDFGGNVKFTEKQEAYYISYCADGSGLPLSSRTASYKHRNKLDHWQTEGSYIYVVVSKNGIENFEAHTIYDTKPTDKTVPIHTAEEASDAVSKKYKDVWASAPVEIKNCSLVYHAVPADKEKNTFEMHPYWEFASKQEMYWYTLYPEKETTDFFNTIFVDAETLEIVYDGNDPA